MSEENEQKTVSGKQITLSGGALVSMFDLEDGTYFCKFESKSGTTTEIRLSGECVHALHVLWFDINFNGNE